MDADHRDADHRVWGGRGGVRAFAVTSRGRLHCVGVSGACRVGVPPRHSLTLLHLSRRRVHACVAPQSAEKLAALAKQQAALKEQLEQVQVCQV
jgi:hypothetical protein